jgi:hypothetical protein
MKHIFYTTIICALSLNLSAQMYDGQWLIGTPTRPRLKRGICARATRMKVAYAFAMRYANLNP